MLMPLYLQLSSRPWV